MSTLLPSPAPSGTVPALPAPTRGEEWASDGGWLVDLLLPATDRGVAQQAVVVAAVFLVLLPRAWRADLTQLWAGGLVFTSSLFVLRGLH